MLEFKRKTVTRRTGLPRQWFRNLGGFPTKREADPKRQPQQFSLSDPRDVRRELGLQAGLPLSGRQWTRRRKGMSRAERAEHR